MIERTILGLVKRDTRSLDYSSCGEEQESIGSSLRIPKDSRGMG